MLIQPNAPMLELQFGDAKRARCAACAKRMFGEDPPVEFPEDTVRVPMPSLPIEPMRNLDFVTPRQIRRSKPMVDITSRILGERE